MIGKLLRSITPTRADFGIKWNDDWKELRSGTTWKVVEENENGIKVAERLTERHKNMETGEIATIVRKDANYQWFENHNLPDWPEYAKEADKRDGLVWEDEVDSDRPYMWMEIISNSGGSLWRRID